MGGSDDLDGTDDVQGLDGLDGWAAGMRADEAARARVRRRWLRRQAEEDANLAGVLADLSDRGRSVSVTTVTERTYAGELSELGVGWLAVHRRSAATVVIALSAVMSVTADGPAASGRGDAQGRRLADRLAEVAAEGPDVLVVCGSGHTVRGRLRAVGLDVVTVALEGQPPAMTYVPLASISEVTLFASG